MTFTCLFLWGRASSWSLSFLFPPAKSGGSLLTALCGYWDNPGYDDIKLLVGFFWQTAQGGLCLHPVSRRCLEVGVLRWFRGRWAPCLLAIAF